MMSANRSSLPATCSAKAILASFPDWTIMPINRSSTETFFPTSINILEPSARHAFSLTVISSLSMI